MGAATGSQAIGTVLDDGSELKLPDEQSISRICQAWVEQEKWRWGRHNLPLNGQLPGNTWSEEHARYQKAVESMESKFAQLAKLKRLLLGKRAPVHGKGCACSRIPA